MPISPEFMRLLLLFCVWGMALLAAIYLYRRNLSLTEYLAWGLLILLVPVLGPFLVILLRPGHPRSR